MNNHKFCTRGEWVEPTSQKTADVTDRPTVTAIAMASMEDTEMAVVAGCTTILRPRE